MGKYKKCPRCELNWIPVEEELCEVCKAELGKASKISLLEDICPAGREEQANAKQADEEDSGDWDDFVDDAAIIDDDEEEVSLNQLQEDEEEEFEDDEEESCPDDFDDSDIGDIDDYDDDEYDEEDEEDDFDDEK